MSVGAVVKAPALAEVDEDKFEGHDFEAGCAIRHLLCALKQFHITAVVILGPPAGNQEEASPARELIAAVPDDFRRAGLALANSPAYGVSWRRAKSSLVAWKNLTGAQYREDIGWVREFLVLGALSLVRVDIPMSMERGFEFFLLGARELAERRDVHSIAYAVHAIWPEVRDQEIVTRFEITPRERAVLILVAGGATAKEAGMSLGCTERTVNFHVANIMAKLQVRNKGALIQSACSLGLI